jgi:hypothetical protein
MFVLYTVFQKTSVGCIESHDTNDLESMLKDMAVAYFKGSIPSVLSS